MLPQSTWVKMRLRPPWLPHSTMCQGFVPNPTPPPLQTHLQGLHCSGVVPRPPHLRTRRVQEQQHSGGGACREVEPHLPARIPARQPAGDEVGGVGAPRSCNDCDLPADWGGGRLQGVVREQGGAQGLHQAGRGPRSPLPAPTSRSLGSVQWHRKQSGQSLEACGWQCGRETVTPPTSHSHERSTALLFAYPLTHL